MSLETLAKILRHADKNNRVIADWFGQLRDHARSLGDHEEAGRDGLRYASSGKRICELHPKPMANPPYVGVWVRIQDQSVLALLKNPNHKSRAGWFAVRSPSDLQPARRVMSQSAAEVTARTAR